MAALRPPMKPEIVKKRVCRRFKSQILTPSIGYGNNKKAKHMLSSGFQEFLVHNIKELEVLLMCNKSYCTEIAHNVSSKNHRAIVERAAQIAIRVTNLWGCASKKMNRQTVYVHIVYVLIKT
ncbi:60S ribosomal protein L32-like [Ursus americanus]|uniref:60S ribosomal protein L32 n=1 Tax=Ursus maritimus TaxID=29073 RepID=A0A8M1GDA1_URSMA|nr:60S ribosomal protein L32-like [Ursus maritimus]XP_045633689.1 60S ribosomal protein L32-like [Ursus americanus]XP_057172832.1 60S ribosomal protein L32-like [Ursus arctos]